MPELPDNLKILLESWVAAGAPEFLSNTGDTKPEAPQAPVGFAEVRDKVLVPNNCVQCHSHFYDYETARRFFPSMVSLVDADKMPFPQREGGENIPVSFEGKELLRNWLAQGAPEFADKEPAPVAEVVLKPTWESLRNNVLGLSLIHI